MPKIFVTRLIPEAGLELLRRAGAVEVWPGEMPPPPGVLREKVREAEGLLALLTDPIDAELIAAAPRLKVISNYAVGYDNIDLAAATARGILVCNTPGVLTETTADLAWALLMAQARRIVPADAYARSGQWQTWGPRTFLGHDVYQRTLGLVGLGRIGQAMARRAKGFAMRILYYSRSRRPELENELGVEYRTLEELIPEADFISLHCPLTEETRHLFGREQFARMKPNAILINTSRGAVVEQAALYQALAEGRIAGAALDVTDPEPPAPEDPILRLENLTIIPHIGSASYATRDKMAQMAAENLLAALSGRRPAYPVNPEVLEKKSPPNPPS
jgi:glyoxylate reductase